MRARQLWSITLKFAISGNSSMQRRFRGGQQASRSQLPLQFFDGAVCRFRAVGSFHPPQKRADDAVLIPDRPPTYKDLRVIKRAYANCPVEIGQVGIERRCNANIAHAISFDDPAGMMDASAPPGNWTNAK
jgi:hypothetical protein